MKHRGLTLKRFVAAIPWELFERYFTALQLDNSPNDWAFINADAMQQFLEQPENIQARGVILEDFQRINDICESAMSLLVRAHVSFGLEFDDAKPRQELAMRLFLDHNEAFEYAWSLYLLMGVTGKQALYPMSAPLFAFDQDRIEAFQNSLREWFHSQAKGDVCNVYPFEEKGEFIVRMDRGSYVRTVAQWQGSQITFTTFRPASEDVLLYDPGRSRLQIKATLAKDRDQYVRSFATHLALDSGLADEVLSRQAFSLRPLQDGSFDYAGDGQTITGVDLVKVQMRLQGASEPEIEVRSSDVRWTFDRDLPCLELDSGELTMARFRFRLHPQGRKPTTVTFEIEPPGRTDLAQKRYADTIENYLMRQKVKLV